MSTMRTTRSTRAGTPGPTLLVAASILLLVVDVVVLVSTGTEARYLVTWILAVAGLLAAGIVIARDPDRAGTGAVLIGAAAAAALWDTTAEAYGGPFPFLSGLLYWPYAGLLVWAVLRWPDDRVTGAVPRVLLGVVVLVLPVLTLVWQLTWSPEGAGTADWWWVTVVRAPGLSDAVYFWQQVLLGLVVLCLVALLVVRTVRARGDRRTVMWPVTIGALVLGAAVAATAFGIGAVLDLGLVTNVALLVLPAGMLVAEHRARRS